MKLAKIYMMATRLKRLEAEYAKLKRETIGEMERTGKTSVRRRHYRASLHKHPRLDHTSLIVKKVGDE